MTVASPYLPVAKAKARKYEIPVPLFLRLIQQESHWDPDIRSPAGAIGLGQLMPGTASGLGVDPYNPGQNLEGAARYLSDQYRRFHRWDLALAAYNAGPGAVAKYGGIPPYSETRGYVRNVLGGFDPTATTVPDGRPATTPPLPSGPPPASRDVRPSRPPVNLATLLPLFQQTNRLLGLPLLDPSLFAPPTVKRSRPITVSPPVRPQAPRRGVPASPRGSRPAKDAARPAGVSPGALAEAFYDPLGQYDNGRFSKQGIGGHSNHVHLSITNPQAMLAAIEKAQQLGLHVSENPYLDHVDPVHVPDSYHYRTFPGTYNGRKLGEAIDVSGSPQQMAAYYRWATANLR